MKNIPNCYNCIHRGTVPGDAHSCCRHPDLKGQSDDPIGGMIDMFSGTGCTKIQVVANKFQIQANYHGIKRGWFIWPWNFDPVWLENCNAFEKKS